MSIEENIKKVWLKVEEVDKKAFLIFFIAMNIVYLYHSLYGLFGNHDIHAMFNEHCVFPALFAGRYSVSWLEIFFANKSIIPLFINMILFFFLSISAVMTLNWLKLKKNLAHYLLAGFFILLTPCLYSVLWYRITAFGHLMSIFFTIVSFFLCEKISNDVCNKRKILYFSLSLLFMTVFVFGSYPPCLGVVCGLIIAKLFVDCFDNDFSNLNQIISRYRYVYFVVILSLLLNYMIYQILDMKGIVDNSVYCNNLIGFVEFFKNIPKFLSMTFVSFYFDAFPYVGRCYKVLFCIITLLSIIGLCIEAKTLEKKKYISRICFIVLGYLLLFYILNIVYIISPIFFSQPRFFRLEYWSTVYFVFICIVFAFKSKNYYVRNSLFIFLSVLIFIGIRTNFHIQKDQLIGQLVDLSRVMTVKELIMSNKNYQYTDHIAYEFVQIGDIENVGKIDFYRSNEYNNSYFDELLMTFQSGIPFLSSIVYIPPKINNINPYSINCIQYPKDVEKYIDDDLKSWLLNDAESYPAENCVFINKGKIFFVMNSEILYALKIELSK